MLGAGYPIAAEAFDLELYQLACTFAASRELARLASDHPGLGRLSRVFQQSEAARRLVAAAAMIRSAMDTWSSAAHSRLDATVGELVLHPHNCEQAATLNFREACNKILHADSIELLDQQSDSDVLKYDIVLEGRKGQEEWRALLSVTKFVDVASHVA